MDKTEGLIFAYILDQKGGGEAVNWEMLDRWSLEKGPLWMHLNYANEKARRWLFEKSNLSPLLCESLLAEDTRPRCVLTGEGLLLILRGVNCNPGSDPEDMVSIRMLINENRIITMRHRRVMAIDDINSEIQSGTGPTSCDDFLVMVSRLITNRIGDVISEIDDSVDELEDSVLTAESHELRPKLSSLRRQTISLRRYIAPQRDVLSRL